MSDARLDLIFAAKNLAGAEISGLNKQLGGLSGGAESLTGKLQGVGKGIVLGAGIASFNLLTDAVQLGIGKLGEAHEAFLQDEAGQKLLAQALGNTIPNWDGNTKGAEDYASAQAKLGFADDEVRASLGQLVGVTHNLTEAQQLNSLAQDLARAKGIDLATATDIVTKAHEGNGKALKGLGVDISGLTTGAQFLDAVQKNVAGSAETWANTNEGKLAVSNVKVGEAMEKVGGIVDKVAQVAAPALADALTFVADVFTQVWDAIQPVVDAIASGLQPVIQAIGPIATQVFAGIKSVVQALAPVFQSVFGTIGSIIGTAQGVFQTLLGVAQSVGGGISGAFQTMSGIVGGVFNGLTGIVRGAINTVIGIVNAFIRFWDGLRISVPSIDVPFVGTVGGFSVGVPYISQIPYLAKGGPVVPGQAYIVGERGPELFVSDQPGHVIPGVPAGSVGNSAFGLNQGRPVEIPIYIDDREIARVVDRRLYIALAGAGGSSRPR